MIRSFKDKEAENPIARQRSRWLPPDILRTALKKLMRLQAATSLGDLRIFPGDRLEALKGNREGAHSLRINDQWRICFIWGPDNNAYDVEICDYH
ncbi:type II toxin-antitoxin system RelE/ParE family toxin [Thermodesulfobacteriota bacterium]